MNVSLSNKPASVEELAKILNQEFSRRYSYKLFNFRGQKSIIVRKSTFIGAQISTTQNEIIIEGIQPSIPAVIFSFLLVLLTGFSAPLSHLPWKKLEKELGVFFTRKYT